MQLGKLNSFVIGLALLTGINTQAAANVINYDNSFAFNQAGITAYNDEGVKTRKNAKAFYVPMFDDALGTLLDVEIAFDTNWSFSSTFKAKDPQGKQMGTGGAGTSLTDIRVRLVDPKNAQGKNTVERMKQVVNNNCLAYAKKCRDNDDLSGNFSGMLDWAGGLALADFIGTGDLKFSMFRKMTAKVTTCYINDTCFQKNRRNNWSGNLTVNYTYAVPEPATLTLLGLGLIGIGARRIRERKI